MQEQNDPDTVRILAVFESDEKARERGEGSATR